MRKDRRHQDPSRSSIELKSPDDIEIMREGGRLLGRILRQVAHCVAPGVTTLELDQKAQKWIEETGSKPAFLGYQGFPGTLCTSVNEEIVHGIPSDQARLQEGDIVSIDCGLFYQNRFFVDTAITVPVGSVNEETKRLLDTTRRSLNCAIEACQPGNRLGDLGEAVQTLAESEGFGVVREYTGHGIGRRLHEPPQIPNHGKQGQGLRFQEGMVVAIEPMLNQGTHETELLDDDWTVVTADRKLSCHFEHTVAITESGPVILTLP